MDNSSCRHKGNLAYYDNRQCGVLRSVTVGQMLSEAVEKYGRRTAVLAVEQRSQLNYTELLEEVDRFAAGLKLVGLRRGDKVGIWAANFIEWHVASLACARGGFTTVSINPALQQSELAYSLNKSGARCLIFPELSKSGSTFSAIHGIYPNYEKKGVCEKVPTLEFLICITDKRRDGMLTFTEVMNKPSKDDIDAIKMNQDSIDTHEVCNIQFSSGTTGKPKAIPRTHYQVVNNSVTFGKRLLLDLKQHSVCFQVPMFHTYGLLAQTMFVHYGAQIVYPSIFYNPEKAISAAEKFKLSVLMGTPTMFIDLLAEHSKNRADIKAEIGVTGGASISPQLVKNIKKSFKINQLYSLYGMTEALATFVSFPGDNWERETSTVGRIMDNMEAKVVDNENRVVPFGTAGELCTRGYNSLDKYIADPQKTKEVIDDEGWLHSGDQFILTEDGYGRVVGRIKDLVIRGGENIHPQEIEDYLMTHDHIMEVAVIGVPHERLGEDLCACVILKPGKTLTLTEMRGFCKGQLAYFKIPARLEIMEAFPKTASGKIQKYKIVELVKNAE